MKVAIFIYENFFRCTNTVINHAISPFFRNEIESGVFDHEFRKICNQAERRVNATFTSKSFIIDCSIKYHHKVNFGRFAETNRKLLCRQCSGKMFHLQLHATLLRITSAVQCH